MQQCMIRNQNEMHSQHGQDYIKNKQIKGKCAVNNKQLYAIFS